MHIRVTARSVRDACAASLSATTRFRPAFAVAITALASAAVLAAMPAFWTVSTQADFLKGDVEDLSIDSDGRVFLGPSTALVAETAAPFLWSIVAGARRHALGRNRQRRQGPQDRQGRQGRHVLRRAPSSRSMRSRRRRTTGSTWRPRRTGKIYHVAADGTSRRRSSIRKTSTSGRSPSIASGDALRGHW